MPDSDPEFARWLIDSLACGVLAIDECGRLSAINAEAQRILGCPRGSVEQALGSDCRLALAARPVVAQLLLGAARSGAAHARAQMQLEPDEPDAPGRTIGFSLAPVCDAQGHVRGASLFFRDLSSFERMGEQERLRDRLAALGEMAAGMAHEIRNPLAAMEVMAGLLRRRLEGRADELSLLDELTSELRAVERVVGEGLDFVRARPPLLADVDLPHLVERALAQARSRVRFGGSVEVECETRLPRIMADPDQLQAALSSLCVNAMQAMRAAPEAVDSRLVVRLASRPAPPAALPLRLDARGAALEEASRRADGAVGADGGGAERELVISVADNGPGIPQELRERVFYPFFTTRESGAGVGLASAQKIAASHGGRIDLESPTGGGSIFHLRLPLRRPGALADACDRAGVGGRG